MGLIDSSRLKTIICDGVVGTSMLEESQINALVEYISRAFYPVNGKVDVADKLQP